MLLAAKRLRDYNHDNAGSTIVVAVFVLGSLYPLWPTVRAFAAARSRSALLRDSQLVPARRAAAGGREEARIAMGYATAGMIVAGLLLPHSPTPAASCRRSSRRMLGGCRSRR